MSRQTMQRRAAGKAIAVANVVSEADRISTELPWYSLVAPLASLHFKLLNIQRTPAALFRADGRIDRRRLKRHQRKTVRDIGGPVLLRGTKPTIIVIDEICSHTAEAESK